jgi:2-haloacid dehalogenase
MPKETYRAVVFDLLTALLDSWSLWNEVAGSKESGIAWRMRYLKLTYEAGTYRPYQQIIEEAAQGVGISPECPSTLIARWSELKPWPEASRVVETLAKRVPVAVATNASIALGNAAAARVGVPNLVVVTAEEAGYYKPDLQPYRMALERIQRSPRSALFVAGSPADVQGATRTGMTVFWHNRTHLDPTQLKALPQYVSDSLDPLLEIV